MLMRYVGSEWFLLIFLSFFPQFGKNLISDGLNLVHRMFRQVAIVSECLLDLLDLVDLSLVLPFIMANLNL